MGITHHMASDYKREQAIRAKKERNVVRHVGQSPPQQPLHTLIADERSHKLWILIESLPPGEQLSVSFITARHLLSSGVAKPWRCQNCENVVIPPESICMG